MTNHPDDNSEKSVTAAVEAAARTQMHKGIEALQRAFARLRTGRANPGMLDNLRVDYYGQETPLNQVAGISVEEGRALLIAPWEASMLSAIEQAILKSDLGLTPVVTADMLRLPVPALTEESRKKLIKQARADAEQCRVAIRKARRDANSACKTLLKDKEIDEDQERQMEAAIQKLTDSFVSKRMIYLKKKKPT